MKTQQHKQGMDRLLLQKKGPKNIRFSQVRDRKQDIRDWSLMALLVVLYFAANMWVNSWGK